MPIYEYKCPSCENVFEEWVKSYDTCPQPCPSCGTDAQHIVSQTTFVLKGGGWYVTEYGNRKNGQDGASAPAHSQAEGQAASQSDATPAAASDNAATSSSTASASASSSASSSTAAQSATSGSSTAAA